MTMDLKTATRYVSLRVAAEILRQQEPYAIHDHWDNHDRIGEHDWHRVAADVGTLAELTDCSDQHYADAIVFLAGRADPE